MKPKVLFTANEINSSSALFNILDHIRAKSTKLDGITIHRSQIPSVDNISQYSAVVFDSPYASALWTSKTPPHIKRVTLFHLIGYTDRERAWQTSWLREGRSSLVICTEKSREEYVRSKGFDNIITIPFSFDTSRFYHLPYPSEFTVGFLGVNSENKRIGILEKIANKLNIPCVISTRNDHSGGVYSGKELEFYKQISCYVCTAWDESGPLPPIEALLCGRPVITTPVGMMPVLVTNNGILIPNSWDHEEVGKNLERALLEMKAKFDSYKANALNFTLPETAHLYEQALLEVIDA